MSSAEEPPGAGTHRQWPSLEPGTMISRYRVLRRIGAGAMGEVYLAVDEQLGRSAAVKVLGARLVSPTIKERFLREARALAHLSHPHLITVFEAGHVGVEQRPYFAMELLEGGDTEKLLAERGPLPSGVVALIGAQAAAGLGEAARKQIIHRDVKPANLGISAHGVLKVTDFGLAKSYAAQKSLTGEGLVVGTADYIAPEQASGNEVDERADVYALGCTLFHLLTGRPPFISEGRTQVDRYVKVMQAHVHAPVPDARRFSRNVDGALAELVMGLMAKDPDERPTFDELAPTLVKRAARLGGELPRVTRKLFTLPGGAEIPEPTPPAGATVTVAPSPPLRATRVRWPLLAAAVVLALAGTALAVVLLR